MKSIGYVKWLVNWKAHHSMMSFPVQGMWFSSLEELLENKDDIICYENCDSMEKIARYYVEETGGLGEIPSKLQNYIDYQALGRDMEIEGNFLVIYHGVFEYVK